MNLLYIVILTNPTTGRVTTSFSVLEDITIAIPKAYIAFTCKRVMEKTLCQKIIDGFQVVEFLFDHGLLDSIVSHNLLKSILSEIFDSIFFHQITLTIT
jgi:acetyl-CoA carboxylase carboxyl transferase subunit beta